MLYQKILEERSPYMARVGALGNFCEHRHADVEINYCLEGSYRVIIDKKPYTVAAGQFSFIGPMISHEYQNDSGGSQKVLTLVFGVSFLKKYFARFSKISPQLPVVTLDSNLSSQQKLIELFEETAAMCSAREQRRELLIQGNLYKICDYLINMSDAAMLNENSGTKDLRRVESIEKALSLIYYHYSDDITVDDAAMISGYGKSNFCKIFKDITGSTFHTLLNKQRVETACDLLTETYMPISEIGAQVGLSEPKTFCRIFKAVMGVSPGTYRNEYRRK